MVARVTQGHGAIISALGTKSVRETPTLITDTVRAVIESAKTSGVDRFVLVSAFGVGDSLLRAAVEGTFVRRTAVVIDAPKGGSGGAGRAA